MVQFAGSFGSSFVNVMTLSSHWQKQNTLQEDVELLNFIPVIAVNKLGKIDIRKATFAYDDYVPGPEIFKQRQTDQRIKTRL